MRTHDLKYKWRKPKLLMKIADMTHKNDRRYAMMHVTPIYVKEQKIAQQCTIPNLQTLAKYYILSYNFCLIMKNNAFNK